MANLNKVMLIGNLTRDVETSSTPKGSALGKTSIAVNRKWKDDSNESHEEVTFVELEVWGKRAEVLAKYVGKGDPIYVEGRLKLDTWEDKNSGEKKSRMKVVVEDFQFLSSGKSGDKGEHKRPNRPSFDE